MSAQMELTFRNVATVGFNSAALFGQGSALIIGATIFHSFIGGPIAFSTVPRSQFRALQTKIFPVLFGSQAGISGALLALWMRMHPRTRDLNHFFNWRSPDALTGLCLAGMTLAGALNLLVVGPATTKVMNDRVRLEAKEGKNKDDPNPSEEMKKLNVQFGSLHGASSLVNLVFVGASLLAQSLVSVYGI